MLSPGHGYVWAVDSGDRLHVDGASRQRTSSSRGWLLLVGLAVGLAAGVLFIQSLPSSEAGDEALPSGGVTSTTSNSALAEPVADVEALRAQLAEAEAGLAQAEERAFELGLLFDPASYAPFVGCEGSGPGGSLADGWEEEVHIVGQVWFYRLSEAFSTGDPIVQVLAGVEPLQAVTLVVPASERGRYSLLWNPVTDDGTVASGGRAVTLRACRDHATWFTVRFVTSEAYCAPLDLYFQGQRDPVRVVLPFGGVDCTRQSAALLRPSPGPLPDVTGMTLREAWLAIRLVGLKPGVTYDDPPVPRRSRVGAGTQRRARLRLGNRHRP